MAPFARLTFDLADLYDELTPCAYKLHVWLLTRCPAGKPQEAWLEVFAEKRDYSLRQVRRAIRQLIDLGLVEPVHRFSSIVYKLIAHNETTLKRAAHAKTTELQPPPSVAQPLPSETEASNPDAAELTNREEIEKTETYPPSHPVFKNEPEGKSRDPQDTRELAQQQILNEVEQELKQPLNKNIRDRILNTPIGRVRDALDVFRDAVLRGNPIKNPLGWFVAALKKGYRPRASQRSVPDTTPVPSNPESVIFAARSGLPEDFNEWFNLARKLGLALGSGEIHGVLHIYMGDRAEPYEQLKHVWPLSRLRALVG